MRGGQVRPWLRRLGAGLLALPLLLGLGLAALAWRLAQGPLELPPLARAIEAAANGAGEGPRLEVGRASLAWEGWRGGAAPLDIRVERARLRGPGGEVAAELPDAAVALALRPLLRGDLAPSAITLRGLRLELVRDAEGGLSLAGAGPGAAAAEGGGDREGFAALLGEVLRPPGEGRLTALRRVAIQDAELRVADEGLALVWRLEGLELVAQRGPAGGVTASGRAALRAEGATIPVRLQAQVAGEAFLRVELPALRTEELARALPPLAPLGQVEASVAVQALAELGLDGQMRDLRLALAATEGGALRPRPGLRLPFEAFEAELALARDALHLRAARLALPGGEALSARGRLDAVPAGWSGALDLSLEGLTMAGLARHWPEGLAPNSRAAALSWIPQGALREGKLRLDLAADSDLGGWAAKSGRVEAVLEGALLRLPGSPVAVPVRRVEAALDVAPEELRLDRATLALTGGPGAQETLLRLSAAASRAEEAGRAGWRGTAEARLDRVRFQDLAALWPEALAPGARGWMTRNVTAGEVRDGRWQLRWGADAGLSDIRLLSLSGAARAEGATVHWLRPIPPARGVAAEATFSRDEVVVRTAGGRQEEGDGRLSGVEARSGVLRFQFAPPGAPDRAEMEFRLAGPAAEVAEILKHPRLRLFERRPFPVRVAAGSVEGRLTVAFPLLREIPLDALRLRAETRIAGGRLTRALLGRDLEALNLDLAADLQGLRIGGTGQLAGIPLRLQVETDFRGAGGPGSVFSRETVSGRADAAQIAALGFGTGGFASGPIAVEARSERRRNGSSSVALRGDLRDATLAFAPLRWEKRPGAPGLAEATLRLQDDRLSGLDGIRVEAAGLSARGRAQLRNGRVERVEIADSAMGGTRASGEARPPERDGQPWAVTLRGPVADLRPVFEPRARPDPPAAPEGEEGDPVLLDARFDRVLLGPDRAVYAVQARARADGRGVLREASLRGRTERGGGGFEASLSPRADGSRHLRVEAGDGGAFLRALGITASVAGGGLSLDAAYPDARPGSPLSGVAVLDNFAVRDAPALGKLLQAVTLFGLVEAAQGGSGLAFSRAIVPFTLTPAEVRLAEARAFSASLGLTLRGRVQREPARLDLEGTIVPAYVLNTLLGNLPLVGRLFSPEQGGGVFAATFRAQGPAEDATVTVNPLAALAPGFLRGLFQLGEGPPRAAAGR